MGHPICGWEGSPDRVAHYCKKQVGTSERSAGSTHADGLKDRSAVEPAVASPTSPGKGAVRYGAPTYFQMPREAKALDATLISTYFPIAARGEGA